ncbi:MAG: phosphate acetyltransferase [Campylobacterota bacterium]|nr:phosphate acetyltransferase [Campylobacterota bacterium]
MATDSLNSLYIVSKHPKAGSMVVALGMVDFLKRHYGRIAFFRPLVYSADKDEDTQTIQEWFGLKQSYTEAVGIQIDEAEKLISEDLFDEFMGKLLDRYLDLKKHYDFVICLGLADEHLSSLIDYDINVEIAKNFSAPIVGVFVPQIQKQEEVTEEINLWKYAIKMQGAELFMLFVNRCENPFYKIHREALKNNFSFPVALLPNIKDLDSISVSQIVQDIKADLLSGSQEMLYRIIGRTHIAAMNIDHFLTHIRQKDIIVTSADRSDIIFAAILAHHASSQPSMSAILLCGDFKPAQSVMHLLESIEPIQIPILYLEDDIFTVLEKLQTLTPGLSMQTPNKIATALSIFNSNISTKELIQKLSLAPSNILTPAMFKHQLFERAAKEIKSIVLTEAEDDRILIAADILLRRRVASMILLGAEAEIVARAKILGLDLKGAVIIDPADKVLKMRLCKCYFKLRKHKGMTIQEASEAISNKTLFGTMLVYEGMADGMVSGATHTTRETILPALQTIKTKPGFTIVSSCFFMCFDREVLVYADCAVNPDPDAEQLAQIAIASADTAQKFGLAPRVAMLSYSSGSSGTGAEVEKVRKATEIVRQKRPDLLIEGPIQYDAAVDPAVGANKMPGSKVAGHANVFIFPDLNTGNNTYKAVQRSAGAIAVGPILLGLKKPVNDLSRGCSVVDIVNTVALTAIQAQNEEQQ